MARTGAPGSISLQKVTLTKGAPGLADEVRRQLRDHPSQPELVAVAWPHRPDRWRILQAARCPGPGL